MTDSPQALTQVRPISWEGDWRHGHVRMLDQLLLPSKEVYHDFDTCQEMARSIRDMIIRGAPAIGIAAAYGFFLGVRETYNQGVLTPEHLVQIREILANTRPTAVNLFWALERMHTLASTMILKPADEVMQALYAEAVLIHSQDINNNIQMGLLGAELVPQDANILTHCNTGGLATGAYGTALGVIRAAHSQGKVSMVYADETRPYLQGARLTAWECIKDHIPCTLITDSMAAYFMQQKQVDLVVVGTDRTTANGDVANKIGTYGLAVLCKHHNIPFYVAAPLSSIDMELATGAEITIEERSDREVTHIKDHPIAPEGIKVRHPAFDVTPAELVTAIITEKGIARAPYGPSLAALKNL